MPRCTPLIFRCLIPIAVLAGSLALDVPGAGSAEAGASVQSSDVESLGKELQRAAGKGDLDGARRLVRELGESGDPAATDWILKSVIIFDDAELVGNAIDALRSLGIENVAETCESYLAKSKTPPLLAAVIIVVAEGFADERSEKWLVDGLNSKSDLVLRNSIDALVVRKSKAGIPALIGKLESIGGERSTVYYAVLDGLLLLTGQEYETIEDWRKFWEIQGPTLDPANLDAGDGTTGVERKKARTPRDPEFFGVEVVSQKVMFVIDTSGSMVLYDEGGGEEGGGKGASWQQRQRIKRVRDQLKAVIQKLRTNSRFNIISYSDQLQNFNEKGIVPASGTWKKKAVQFADGLKANGFTHTDEAMRAAFQDKSIDTIMLLSDGAPVHDGSQENLIPRILDDVRKMNRVRKVKIYTFGFDGPGVTPPNSKQPPNANPAPLVEFLTRLAEDNGGTYTSIR